MIHIAALNQIGLLFSEKSNRGLVFYLDNIAKGRPTSQSSTHHGAAASRAADGNNNPVFVGLSCTHTEMEVPWWQVDLEREEEVLEVKITNRQESHGRLKKLHVYIGNNGDDGPSNKEYVI